MEKYFKEIEQNKLTFLAIVDDEIVYQSNEYGVIPLLKFMNLMNKADHYVIYDKLLGITAAQIILTMRNIVEVNTFLITEEAFHLLESMGIKITYMKMVDKILNRDKTDLCPIEKLWNQVQEINTLMPILYEFYRKKGVIL